MTHVSVKADQAPQHASAGHCNIDSRLQKTLNGISPNSLLQWVTQHAARGAPARHSTNASPHTRTMWDSAFDCHFILPKEWRRDKSRRRTHQEALAARRVPREKYRNDPRSVLRRVTSIAKCEMHRSKSSAGAFLRLVFRPAVPRSSFLQLAGPSGIVPQEP